MLKSTQTNPLTVCTTVLFENNQLEKVMLKSVQSMQQYEEQLYFFIWPSIRSFASFIFAAM